MDYVQFINAEKLDEEYLRISTNDAGLVDARRFTWLSRNMKNRVLSHSHKLVDAELEGKTLLSSTFDIELECYVTARDLMVIKACRTSSSRFNYKRLDLFRLTDQQREAFLMGAAMIGFANLAEHGEKCRHLCDALEANLAHKKNWTSVTPEAADEIADAWVKRLARQKLETAGTFEVVEELDGGLTLVKLLDQDAYKAEGALMHHCVATYWGGRSSIYSLREGTTRLVTIEIDAEGQIVQARGPSNAAPTEDQAKVLAGVYERHGWKPRPRISFGDIRGLHNGALRADVMLHGPRGDQGFVGVANPYPSLLADMRNAPTIHLAEGLYVLDVLTVRDRHIDTTFQVIGQESNVEWAHGNVRVTATVHGAVRCHALGEARVVRHGVEALLTDLEIFAQMEDTREPYRSRLTFEIPAHQMQRFYQGN